MCHMVLLWSKGTRAFKEHLSQHCSIPLPAEPVIMWHIASFAWRDLTYTFIYYSRWLVIYVFEHFWRYISIYYTFGAVFKFRVSFPVTEYTWLTFQDKNHTLSLRWNFWHIWWSKYTKYQTDRPLFLSFNKTSHH